MTTNLQTPAETSAQNAGGKYLTFKLNTESYGIPVLKVREIIRMTDITSVPQMPEYIQGVINLRGKVIPVIDLRLRFGHSRGERTERTCIIVAQTARALGAITQIGFIVDAVEEVVTVGANDIEETPDFGCDAEMAIECITGMAKINGKVKALLDIDHLLTDAGRKALEPSAL